MGLFDRFRRGSRAADAPPCARRRAHRLHDRVRASDRPDEEHLHNFVTARRGVEGFVEPRTAVSDVTLLLVAHDGEWTRRRVPSVAWAHDFCNKHQRPVVRRRGGRHPAADARLQPPQEAAGRPLSRVL